jgi:DNA-binding HxlR family transcriptional regulator
MPPHRWLLKRRIERAKELLLGGKLELAQIALDCGFNDQSQCGSYSPKARVRASGVGFVATRPFRLRHGSRMMAEMLAGPLERVFSALSGRGNVTVIFHLLGAEASRFSELERAMPGISQRRLVKCLRELEANGVVHRVVYHQVPRRVEYRLTAWGRAFAPVLSSLRDWCEVSSKT